MTRRKFDRFMVDVHIAANPKLARLTAAERWCFVGGILSLAALAPVRGRLLIGQQRVEPSDVATRAGVSAGVAKAAMAKLRAVGVIVPDAELDCEAVHDFDEWNPPPKNDPTNAERQRRYRERRNGTVTAVTGGAVTLPEVEVEVGREEESEGSGGAPSGQVDCERPPTALPTGFLRRVP